MKNEKLKIISRN